jgi:uncharacterized membrane protein
MPLSRETLEKRAVKAGVKAAVKLERPLTKDELMELRVQSLSNGLRVFLVLTGTALIASAWFAWPYPNGAVRGVEIIVGIITFLFGLFGIRRTLSNLFENSEELACAVIEIIAGIFTH